MCTVCWGKEKVSDTPKVGLQVIMSYDMGLKPDPGTETS